jgi:EAL domain-containing protein (putative c-di-GMP-specific phosphodiesterase class I)
MNRNAIGAGAPSAPPSMLVVEDEPHVGQLIANLAASVGMVATVVRSAREMERHLDRHAPAAISVDLRLAGGHGGVDVLGLLGVRRLQTPIILVSGADESTLFAARETAQDQGLRIAGLLQKPFDNAVFCDLLVRACSSAGIYQPAELLEAIARNALFLEFQPKMFVGAGQGVAGAEALVRWQHPLHGVVPPTEFLSAAESPEAALPLTIAVLRAAAAQWRTWKDAGHDIQIAVNMPAAVLSDIQAPARLRVAADLERCPPLRISLELRDESLSTETGEHLRGLVRLEAAGFGLSLDDCSGAADRLARLRGLPFSEIKIASSVVRAVTRSDGSAIARQIVSVGYDLGLAVCAMGVESDEAHAKVAALGCDFAQGYYYGRPKAPRAALAQAA